MLSASRGSFLHRVDVILKIVFFLFYFVRGSFVWWSFFTFWYMKWAAHSGDNFCSLDLQNNKRQIHTKWSNISPNKLVMEKCDHNHRKDKLLTPNKICGWAPPPPCRKYRLYNWAFPFCGIILLSETTMLTTIWLGLRVCLFIGFAMLYQRPW